MKVLFERRAGPWVAAAGALLALALVDAVGPRQAFERTARELSEARLAGWPAESRRAAEGFLRRYGPADEAAEDALTWRARRPFKRVVVWRDRPDTPVTLVVDYAGAARAQASLRALDHGLTVDASRAELLAQAGSAPLATLLLNVADEVARGRRTPEEGRAFYLETAGAAARGERSLYLDSLLFRPRRPERPLSPLKLPSDVGPLS